MTGAKLVNVGVVGAGVMGRGIAQLVLASGRCVWLVDANRDALDNAREEIASRLKRLVEKKRITADQAERSMKNLSLCDDLSELADVEIVVEAIIEEVEAKQDLVKSLEAVLSSNSIIASNTSSFLISEIALSANHPERVIGLHFFNPVPLMRLVEVVGGVSTDPENLAKAEEFVRSLGHIPVCAADVNGFIVNQLGRGYVLEAARIAEEQIADFSTIDWICSHTMGFPMGPFELMDLTGLDVTYPASRAIWEGNGYDSRFLPPALLSRRYKAGHFGRKVGKGFHVGERHLQREIQRPVASRPMSVWMPPDEREEASLVLTRLEKAGLMVESDDAVSEGAIVLLPIDGAPLTMAAYESQIDPARCLGFDPDFSADDGIVLVKSRATKAAVISALEEAGVRLIEDGYGTIPQRIALQLALIGGDMIDRGVASEAAIDQAVMVALGHAEGPLQRARRIGLRRLEQIRARIYTASGADRFRPSRWLTEAALIEV